MHSFIFMIGILDIIKLWVNKWLLVEILQNTIEVNFCGLMANVLDSDIIICELELHSHYYVHFWVELYFHKDSFGIK